MTHDNQSRDLTLVIPSKNRKSFLIRSVDYWRKSGASVVVLEDSDEACVLLEEMADKDCNLKYIWARNTSVADRLHLGTSQVETKFCMWISDDEYVLAPTLSAAMNEIDDFGWIGCTGPTFAFNYFLSGIFYKPQYRPKAILGDDPRPRLMSTLTDYREPLLWCLYKTDFAKEAAQNLSPDFISVGGAYELAHASMMAIQGKIGLSENFVRLRSKENPNQWRPRSGTHLTIKSWWEKESFARELLISRLLDIAIDESSKRLSRNQIYEAFEGYMDKEMEKQNHTSQSSRNYAKAALDLGTTLVRDLRLSGVFLNSELRRLMPKFIRADWKLSDDVLHGLKEVDEHLKSFYKDQL